jgi:hypothetical protein
MHSVLVRFYSGAALTGEQITRMCKETSIFPWSAQAPLNPTPVVRYA